METIMRRSKWRGRTVGAVCLTLIATILSGCLNMEETVLGRYDAAKDEFVFLNLYQRISGEKPEDFEYLYGLWKNRDHLVTPPFPGILGKTSFLRQSAKQYAQINLGSAPASLEPQEALMPLEGLTVKPGTFFLRGADTLCYYDQIIVPGKYFDDAIVPVLREGVAESIDKEIARRKEGGKRWTIEEFRARSIKNMQETGDTRKPAEEGPDDPLQVLSNDTLKMWSAGLADGTLTVVRKGPAFSVRLPGTEADVKGFIGLIEALRDENDKQVKDHPEKKDIAVYKKLTDVFEVKSASATVMEIQLDVTRFFAAAEAVQPPLMELKPADEKTIENARNAVDAIRTKGVPIDQKLSVDQVLAGFRDGSLMAFPSEHPVAPGEGLIVTKKE